MRDPISQLSDHHTGGVQVLFVSMRAGLIVLLAVLGWRMIPSLHTLFQDSQQATQSEITPETGFVSGLITGDFLERHSDQGYWTFAGCNWQIGRREVSDSWLEKRFDELQTSEMLIRDVSEESEEKLIEVLRQLSHDTQTIGGREIYHYDSVDARLQVVVASVDGAAHIQSAALALRQSAVQWQLWQLLPATRNVTNSQRSAKSHLLPLPMSATQLIGRWSRDNQLQMEIVTLTESAAKLSGRWRSDGWGARDSRLETPMPGTLWQRQDRVVYSWTPDTGKNIRTLVLVDKSQ